MYWANILLFANAVSKQKPLTLLPNALKVAMQEPSVRLTSSVVVRCVGYMDVVEALLPYRNATKIFLPLFDLEKIFHTSKY
jgi:hypothetical protein